MKNVAAIFIAIILCFNAVTGYARGLTGVIAGDASDLNPATFEFSTDNADQQILKKNSSSIGYAEIPSCYGTVDGMRIYVDGNDIASSNYAYPKKIIGMDLSNAAGWPNISIPTGNVAIDPKLGRFKFSQGNNNSPTLISTFDTYDVAYGVSVVDNVAFVASFRSGLYVLDVSNSKKPLLISNYNTTGWAYDVCVKNGYAFVADAYSGLQIIDVSNPKDLSLVGTCYTYGWAYDVFVGGRYAYLADYRSGLQIIDVQNPKQPEVVGTCRTDGTAYGIWVSGQYAYLADGINGLRIIDVSNPNSPRLVSTYDTKGKAYDVQVVGNYAFVADGQYSGLQIIDISNPAAPKLAGCCTTPGISSKIYVSDGYVYLADGQNSGLQIVNAQDVKNPIVVSNYKTPGKAYGVCLSGRCAFVADGSNGLQIIDVPHPSEVPKGKVTTDCYIASDYLILTSPNGTERLAGSKECDITWRISGGVMPYTISLWYSTDHGRTYPYKIVSGISGTSYKWIMPKIDTESLRIKVELIDGNGEYAYDESDASCSVDSTPPFVTGVFPANKLADVPVNTDMVINFSEVMNPSYTEAAFVISPDPGINGYKWSNDGKTLTIDLKSLGYNNLYNCVVTTQATDLYGNPMLQKYESAFYTEKQAIPFQSVLLSPLSGTSFAGGEEYAITWQVSGGKPPYLIDLYYSTDGGKVYLPIKQGLTGNSYQWKVPYGNFNDVKLKVAAVDASGVQIEAINNELCKIDSIPPEIQSISIPSGAANVPVISDIIVNFSEMMDTKKTQEAFSITPTIGVNSCSWSNGSKTLTIDLKNMDYETTYAWKLGTGAVDLAGNSVINQPQACLFTTEKMPQELMIKVISPDGGESFISGSTQNISWKVTGSVNSYSVSLSYSLDGGKSYSSPFVICLTSSPFSWTVPNVNTTQARIKAVVYDGSGRQKEDVSDADFEIDSILPVVKSTIPVSGATNTPVSSDIAINFSDNMDALITQSAFSISPNPGILNYTWTNGTTALNVDMNTLVYNTLYTCTVSTEARDTAGNKMASAYTWTFMTEPVPTNNGGSISGNNGPTLQLYIPGSTYGSLTESWVTHEPAFELQVLGSPSPEPVQYIKDVKLYIAIKESEKDLVGAYVKINGVPITFDVYGKPFTPGHGIYPTHYCVYSLPDLMVNAAGEIVHNYNPGESGTSSSAGDIHYLQIEYVGYSFIHFDASGAAVAPDGKIWQRKAPFSHDAEAIIPFRVQVLSPNGSSTTGKGECWAGGSNQSIQWSMSGGTPPYRVSLSYVVGTNAVLIATGSLQSPYAWNVAKIDSTQVKVKVEVYDVAGKTAVDESDNVFEIDSIPPTVVSTTPANGLSNVDVNIGTITVVFSEEMNTQQSQNAFVITPDVGITGYRWSTDKSVLSIGANKLMPNTGYTCVITTQAKDTCAGNQLVSAYKWGFKTKQDISPLSVVLIPQGLKCIAGGNQQYIEWQATGGIAPYQASLYYYFGSWIEISSNASSPYRWSVPMINSESVKVKVVVKDAPGSTCEAISSVFEVDSILPTILSTIPAKDATDVGITTTISIVFSEEMNTTKTQEAFVISPNPGICGYHWSNGSTTLTVELRGTLSYNTLYTCMLSTSARDTCAGNHIEQVYICRFTTEQQHQPFKVCLVSPQGSSTSGRNECLSGGSSYNINWIVAGGIPPYIVELDYTVGSTTYSRIASGDLKPPYIWTVPMFDSIKAQARIVVRDTAGNEISSTSKVFEIDSTPPTVIGVEPANGVTEVDALSDIVIHFSEDMNISDTQNAFSILPHPGVFGYTWSNATKTLTIDVGTLTYNTQYICMLSTGAKDTCAGNHMTSNHVWSFTTQKKEIPLSLELIKPDSNLKCLAGGVEYNIFWSVSGGKMPYETRIFYSLGSGIWTCIKSGQIQSPYTWIVPKADTINARIKVMIIDAAGKEVIDESPVFEIDSTPPTITNVTPANGLTEMDINSDIIIEFSEEMNHLTQDAFSILPHPCVFGFKWSDDGKSLSVDIGTLSYNTNYVCMVSRCAHDTCAGNHMTKNYVWSFDTKKVYQPLQITIISPNGDKCLAGNREYDVIWTASGGSKPYSIDLYYAIGSNTWTLIASGIKQSPYKWLVPQIDSLDVRLKAVVTDEVSAQASDVSDAPFEIDSTPPQIISTQPSDSSLNVATNTSIVVTFNEEMNAAETEKAFMIIPATGIKGYTWNGSHTIMTVSLDNQCYDTQYSCVITNQAKDTCSGNHMLKNYAFSFTTEKKITPLAVSLISPNGEKACIAGSSRWPVKWTVLGGLQPYKADIYYSMDSGNTWIPIASDVGVSPYLWTVPAIDSINVRVKVVICDADKCQAIDISDIDFEVDSMPPYVVNTIPQDGAINVPVSSSGSEHSVDIPDFTIPVCPNPSDYIGCKQGKQVYKGTVVLDGIEFVNGDVTFEGIVRVTGTGAIVAAGNICARDGLTLENAPCANITGIPIGLLAGGNIEISSGGDRMDVINTHVYAKGTIEIKPQYRSKYKLGPQGLLRAAKVHIYVANPGGGSEIAGFGSEGRIYSEGDCNIWALRGKDAYTDLPLNGEVKAYGNIDLSTIDWDVTLAMGAHIQSKKNVWLKVTHRERAFLGKSGRIFAGESIKIYGVGDSCCFVSDNESKIYAKGNIDIWCLSKDTLNGEVFAGGSIDLASNGSDQYINIGALVCAYNGTLKLKVKHRAVMVLKRYAKLCATGDIAITTDGSSCYFTSEDDTVISSKDGNVNIWALAGETLGGIVWAKKNIDLATVDSDKSLVINATVAAEGNIEVKAKYRERVILGKTGKLLARGSIKTCYVLSGDFVTEEGSIIRAGSSTEISSQNSGNLKGSITANCDVKLPIIICCLGVVNGSCTMITINFSEEMNTSETQASFIIHPNPGIVGYRWSNGTSTLKIGMKPFDYNTEYTCIVTTRAKDTCAGNQMLKDYIFSFTTEKKITPLAVSLIS
ncbi:MAG: choice-of-anchor N protein, partial [bacterium]|nr:choice-of-anchor N protein [bacterium]